MQRVHISPNLGSLTLAAVSRAHVEALGTAMLANELSPKTVRNVHSFLHSVFEHAINEGLCDENPVRRAARPGRRRAGDVDPDLQFLTVDELDAVLRAIPARARLWELADRVFPAFASYRQSAARAGRTIPILQLAPS